jgi:beta-lactam-binding protein with PASTA domain
MGGKIAKFLLCALFLLIIANTLTAQTVLEKLKQKTGAGKQTGAAEAVVPKVVGLSRADAEEAIEKAGLKVANVIERDAGMPAGQVVRQQPEADSKVAKGAGVVIVISTGRRQVQSQAQAASTGTAAQKGKTTVSQSQMDSEIQSKATPTATTGGYKITSDLFGGQAQSVAQTLRAAGMIVQPKMVASDKPRGTVLAISSADRKLAAGDILAKGSALTLEISEGSISMLPPTLKINTGTLQMTGMRIQSQTINTAPLQMTGMRIQSQAINTAPLQMTGMRTQSQTITTAPLKMTGMRQ